MKKHYGDCGWMMENGSESSPGDSPTSESQKLQSMAFTIHFSDNKDSGAVRPAPENLAKLVTKHRRVPSLPNVEDTKRVLSPLPARIRRAGYHSEGYFSSDQEDEHSRRSQAATEIFVKKFKNFEKGLRATNLAQEKKILAEAVSHRQQFPAGFLRDEPTPDYDYDDDADLMSGLDSKRHNTSLNSLPMAAAVETQPSWDSSEDEERELPDGSDACSETGTYTIEKDAPCPEVEEARREVESTVSQGSSNYNGRSLYREGSNWINEWASQVAKHNLKRPNIAGLPPLPITKHQGYIGQQPVVLTRLPSPVQQSPSGRKSAGSNHQDDTGRQSDSSLETESFLRATESVVTAMQARMSLSLDSGGESDIDPAATNHTAAVGERQLGFRRSSGAARSDSSSDTGGDAKTKHKDTPASTPAPQMRYNRAFSLRRARLDCEETPAESRKKKPDGTIATPSPPPASSSRIKKGPEPTKPATKPATPPTKQSTKSPKPEVFSRTDCGRFSVRAPKQSLPSQKSVGQSTKKSGGGRSNSTLSSREVEFQNWKRRKSYDPMKAAAEGKRKEAAKKAIMSNSMTQSSISPSPQSQLNPVLRSASFHGTAGAVLSSEDEEEEEEDVTLSADEDSPPLAAPSSPARTGSRASLQSNSSLRRGKMEALDNLVMAAVCGLSNKLRISSCNVMKKLRYLYEEDVERAEKLTTAIELLEIQGSPQSRSPSKELSCTLKNLKRIENVFKVLDEVLFDEEDFDLDLEVLQ